MSFGQATEAVIPTAFDSGSQNTEKPYAMPMHRWMASAAGGTIQRLNPGPAIGRPRDPMPGAVFAVDTAVAPLCHVAARAVTIVMGASLMHQSSGVLPPLNWVRACA